jgi:hypothetical protein
MLFMKTVKKFSWFFFTCDSFLLTVSQSDIKHFADITPLERLYVCIIAASYYSLIISAVFSTLVQVNSLFICG